MGAKIDFSPGRDRFWFDQGRVNWPMREKVGDINSAKTAKSSNVPSRGMPPRRLAAIVAGDIVGYSRLMELDEEGTHARVKRIQRDLIEPSITEHYGRLVKTTGDGFIARATAELDNRIARVMMA